MGDGLAKHDAGNRQMERDDVVEGDHRDRAAGLDLGHGHHRRFGQWPDISWAPASGQPALELMRPGRHFADRQRRVDGALLPTASGTRRWPTVLVAALSLADSHSGIKLFSSEVRQSPLGLH